ncbi:MAG: hypothetical protein QM690_03695 [Sphingobium sp.]
MQRIAAYQGCFLNHLEGFYRPGDRELAVELVEALGLVATDLQFTASSRPVLAVHPNGDDRDPTNNVMFLYEMPSVQRRFIELLEDRIAGDSELSEAARDYREAVKAMPPIMPHFGLRFASSEALDAALGKLASKISPALSERVSVWEVPPYEPIEGLPDIRQVFVRTDIFSIGASGMEQAFELQVDRSQA